MFISNLSTGPAAAAPAAAPPPPAARHFDPNDVCPITHERLGDVDVTQLPCGHYFESWAIRQWIRDNMSDSPNVPTSRCPVCKQVVPGFTEVSVRFKLSPEMRKLQDYVRKMKKTDVIFEAAPCMLSYSDEGVFVRPHIMPESKIWTEIRNRFNEWNDFRTTLITEWPKTPYTFYPGDVTFRNSVGTTIVSISLNRFKPVCTKPQQDSAPRMQRAVRQYPASILRCAQNMRALVRHAHFLFGPVPVGIYLAIAFKFFVPSAPWLMLPVVGVVGFVLSVLIAFFCFAIMGRFVIINYYV